MLFSEFEFILVALNTVQFVVMNLSMHLSQLASHMLNALCLLTHDSILVIDNNLNIDLNSMSNNAIVLFTTSETISSMKSQLKQLTKLRLLESDKAMIDQQERFGNSEDLILQLVEDLCRYYNYIGSKGWFNIWQHFFSERKGGIGQSNS
jgi:hypothetical protein